MKLLALSLALAMLLLAGCGEASSPPVDIDATVEVRLEQTTTVPTSVPPFASFRPIAIAVASPDLVTAYPSHLDCIDDVKSAGTPYVVDRATGSDLFPGTAKCPLHTIQRAAELMNDNDQSIIREGRYQELVTISGKNNLAFIAADGERAVLDGSADIKKDLGGEVESPQGWHLQSKAWR